MAKDGLKRRDLLVAAAGAAAATAVLRSSTASAQRRPRAPEPRVTTPNGRSLEYRVVDGVKVFHLVAEAIPRHEFCAGLVATCWGYNGLTGGPTIEVTEGDRVRIYVTNRLGEPTTVHWHGIILPSGMDGVGGLSQRPIRPGETFRYEFTFPDAGTFMYHPHWDEMTQMAMGMMGMIVVHPRRPTGFVPDRDFAIMLNEFSVPIGAARPNPLEMNDFNVLTMNSKCFPGTAPLVVRRGDKVRIRFGNLSGIDNHPIHLHGYAFRIAATDGGPIPRAAQQPHTTVIVPTGSCRVIEFVADNPGDWAMHCHMTHHVMNQMGHGVPNMVGVEANASDRRIRRLIPGYMPMGREGMAEMGEMQMPQPPNSIPMRGGPGAHGNIDMGGMFTILKVRENLSSYDEDPGWYDPPEGTQARPATAAELRSDGIELE